MKTHLKKHSDGEQIWYNDGGYPHREGNLPAKVYPDGEKYWMINGDHHRTNGPALVSWDGYKEYHIDGIEQKYPEQYTLWICNKVKAL